MHDIHGLENHKMERTVFVTGADRGLGLALCAALLAEDWQVFAGQFMPEWPELSSLESQYPKGLKIIPLDVRSGDSVRAARRSVSEITGNLEVLINNAGVHAATTIRSIREEQDYEGMQRMVEVNALGALRVVEAFLPLMDKGSHKRLCFVSSEAGSITRSERTAWFGYCMSKAALNMGVKILFNDLHPQGYSFRVYHPGWVRSYMSGEKNMEADLEPEEAAAKALPILLGERADEDRLVLEDINGNEWPW
jgi:NAD(P)-dependent dehydrogenase (short-subunit alcohol dehydrogenase family)